MTRLLVESTEHDNDYGTAMQFCCPELDEHFTDADGDPSVFVVTGTMNGDLLTATGIAILSEAGDETSVNYCPFCGAKVELVREVPRKAKGANDMTNANSERASD